jgi:hypothetical protein
MNQTPQENEDKSAMWRQGEPMPDWARQALAKSIGSCFGERNGYN